MESLGILKSPLLPPEVMIDGSGHPEKLFSKIELQLSCMGSFRMSQKSVYLKKSSASSLKIQLMPIFCLERRG